MTPSKIYAGSAPMEVDAGKAVEGNLYFKNNCICVQVKFFFTGGSEIWGAGSNIG